MRAIIFDAGPIISLTTNNLLWILERLKKRYNGKFYITQQVKKELVDVPLETKKFKFEALQVLALIGQGILEIVITPQINNLTNTLIEKLNTCFKAHAHWINIVHFGEMSVLSSALCLNSNSVVIDERTTRLVIENPERLISILRDTLHTDIYINEKNLNEVTSMVSKIKPIRSVELVTIAYELGILDEYLVDIKNPKATLLESVLWGVKLNGCAVSKQEIKEILRIEGLQ